MNEELINKIALTNPALADSISKNPWFLPTLVLELVMKLIFYPIALYTAAKNQQKSWFVVLFVCMLFLNDFAVLAILYLVFNKRMQSSIQRNLKAKVKSSKKKR